MFCWLSCHGWTGLVVQERDDDDHPEEMLEDFYEHDRYFVKVGLSNQWYLRVISIDRLSNENELDQLPDDL